MSGFLWRAALLWVMAVALCNGASAQQWQEYHSSDGGYRVEFPGRPKLDSEDFKTAFGEVRLLISAEFDRGTDHFSVTHTVFPLPWIQVGVQARLDGARNGSVRAVKGRLRQEQRLTVDGAPASRVVIDIPDSRVTQIKLMVIRGSTLYQADYLGPTGSERSADALRFLTSFRLLPR